jgi:hypothetical protein
MAKKSRKFRSAFGAWRVTLDPDRGVSLHKAVLRRRERERAEQQFPELLKTFAAIKAELRDNLAAGRFEYRTSLAKIYQLVCDWQAKGDWETMQSTIAKLRGVALRANANQFAGIVALCTDRDRQTVSRWSQELDGALNENISPNRLIEFLNASPQRS